jgi:hypothetical protein
MNCLFIASNSASCKFRSCFILSSSSYVSFFHRSASFDILSMSSLNSINFLSCASKDIPRVFSIICGGLLMILSSILTSGGLDLRSSSSFFRICSFVFAPLYFSLHSLAISSFSCSALFSFRSVFLSFS